MIPRSAATFDQPTTRPTPDDITKRAEKYARSRDAACYAGLEQADLQEFHAELARIKRRDRLGAWRQP